MTPKSQAQVGQQDQITHLVPFAAALSKAVCDQSMTRLNTMAILRALNAQPMAEIVNLQKAAMAAKAYLAVLDVLTKVRLQIVPDDEVEDLSNLKLTYSRFQKALSTTKHFVLTINS